MTGAEFWDSSWEELVIRFEGAAKRDAEWFERLTFIAWQMAYWSRVDKFPAWNDVRPTRRDEVKAPAQQSWHVMKAMLKGLHQANQAEQRRLEGKAHG